MPPQNIGDILSQSVSAPSGASAAESSDDFKLVNFSVWANLKFNYLKSRTRQRTFKNCKDLENYGNENEMTHKNKPRTFSHLLLNKIMAQLIIPCWNFFIYFFNIYGRTF